MGRERYVVRLKEEERDQLERLIRGGMSPARKVARARILLKADTSWGIERIMEALDTSAGTVCRTKRRYQEGGLKRALEEDPRPGHPAKLDERGCTMGQGDAPHSYSLLLLPFGPFSVAAVNVGRSESHWKAFSPKLVPQKSPDRGRYCS